MILKKYTELQLREAVTNNFTFRSVLICLGVAPHGGNYEVLRKAIKVFLIDISHFTHQGHLKGKTHNHTTRPLNKVLVEHKLENTYRLKLRLLNSGLKKAICENCNSGTWCGGKIPLELHHIDGIRKNNKLENLKLLCPNCHALTDNYRGKNKEA